MKDERNFIQVAEPLQDLFILPEVAPEPFSLIDCAVRDILVTIGEDPEHHILPFFGKAYVAYIPNGKVIGLSKIPPIVEMYARRLQVQEHMTTEIAHFIDQVLQPRGVAVFVAGSHMCSMMRGVKKPEASMTTNVFLGAFKTDKELRAEFLAQVKSGK